MSNAQRDEQERGTHMSSISIIGSGTWPGIKGARAVNGGNESRSHQP